MRPRPRWYEFVTASHPPAIRVSPIYTAPYSRPPSYTLNALRRGRVPATPDTRKPLRCGRVTICVRRFAHSRRGGFYNITYVATYIYIYRCTLLQRRVRWFRNNVIFPIPKEKRRPLHHTPEMRLSCS